MTMIEFVENNSLALDWHDQLKPSANSVAREAFYALATTQTTRPMITVHRAILQHCAIDGADWQSGQRR